MCKTVKSAFIYQGSQSSQHQKNNLLQAIFFAWLGEGRTGPMVIKDVAALLVYPDYHLHWSEGGRANTKKDEEIS